MKAAWYEKQGSAADVLVVGDESDSESNCGQDRIRVAAFRINPVS